MQCVFPASHTLRFQAIMELVDAEQGGRSRKQMTNEIAQWQNIAHLVSFDNITQNYDVDILLKNADPEVIRQGLNFRKPAVE